MSSYTFDGKITIQPPLNFTQIKQARSAAFAMVSERYGSKKPRWITLDPAQAERFEMEQHMPLTLSIKETERETDEGVVQVRRSELLVPSNSSEGSLSYSMAEQVNRLIKLFPGHTFEGSVVAVEQENNDATKLVVKDNVATDVPGAVYVHFEDGSEAKISDLL